MRLTLRLYTYMYAVALELAPGTGKVQAPHFRLCFHMISIPYLSYCIHLLPPLPSALSRYTETSLY